MFTYRTHRLQPLSATVQATLPNRLTEAGLKHPINNWWPQPVIPGFSVPDGVADGGSIIGYSPEFKRNKSKRVSEFDSLYNGILANPFDAGARRVFLDWLQDMGADSPYLAALANYPAGEFPAVPFRKEFERWEGPGFIVRGAFGTFDTWLGVSGMFVQACRTGLFADMPITTAIVYNLAPIDRGSYCYWFANEKDQTTAINLLRSILAGLTVAECEQSVINDVYATFVPQDGINTDLAKIGVYRAFNHNYALALISDAYVKMGRYACGLPEIDWPERNAVAADHIAGLWRFFRSVYRVDDRVETGMIINQPGNRLHRNAYGRNQFRNLIPSHVRG